jgi:multidrug efflux pump subunit AcrB
VDIDRERAAALAVDARTIERSLYNAYGPSWVSTIYTPNNQFRVLLELWPGFQEHADMVTSLFMHSSSGKLVPLEAITTLREDVGPQSINHSGQLPSVTVSFNLRPGVSLGDAVADVEEVAAHNLPASVSTSFTGTAKVFQDFLKDLGLLLLIAILIVYIVLAVLYESFIHPLTILSGLPSAGFGALLTLLIFRVELTIYAFVGLIMLIGIVKKNAIMQIDFALEAERKTRHDREGSHLRRLPDQVPAHHDDDPCGSVRLLAHRAGLRCGRGSAAPVGLDRGGRPGLFPITDFVSHRRGLYLHGRIAGLLAPAPCPAAVAGGPLLDVKP